MSPSSLALLGQTTDQDSRVDVYHACLVELEQDQRRYRADEIIDAIRLARKDLKLFETVPQQGLHDLALRFMSFVFSTEDLVCHLPDQMILSVFKDLVYVFGKAEAKSCALAAVLVSLEIVSSKRHNLIKRASLALVPSLAECISIRFPDVTLVVKEVSLAIARLCKVVPDTMHALRCSWVHCVLPIALRFSDSEVQSQAISCLEAVRPSCCTVGKALYQRAIEELNENQLNKMCRLASEVDKCHIIPAMWAACMRCLGIYVFGNFKLWNELGSIWKKCFSHGKPDIAIACLESWSIVIEASTTHHAKLQDLRLMKLIVKPFIFMFDTNPKKSEYIQVSVRMKAIDIWSKLLNVIKCHKITGEIFQEVVCPVMLKMLLSGESAILIAACNLLGSFFNTGRDSFALTSQPSFSIVGSQLTNDLASESDRIQYFNAIFPHFVPIFKALLHHRTLQHDIHEIQFGAIKNSWRFFLSSLSQLDKEVVQSVVRELIMSGLDIGSRPIRFQYVECIFAVLAPSIWLGEDHTPVTESAIGRLCERYLAAFAEGQQNKSIELRLCEEWPKFTMALSSACCQHRVEQRLVLLSVKFLEPIFRNEMRISHRNVVAYIHLARATCAAICQNTPVDYNVRYFHAICMDLINNILTSQDFCVSIAANVNNCFQQQIQRFALVLLRSIVANETFPVDSRLLKEYEPGIIAMLQSCQTLRVYACRFLDQAFGITPYCIPESISCSPKMREAIIASNLHCRNSELMSQSAHMEQEAYNAWQVLYENFESATEKLLSTSLRPDLRSKVCERIKEQRIYLEGLLSISSELSYSKR